MDLRPIGIIHSHAHFWIVLTESCREDAGALYRSAGYEGRWAGFKKKL